MPYKDLGIRRLHHIWIGMKSRCLNINNDKYHDYGGRGIKICEEWLIFKNFKDWSYSNGYLPEAYRTECSIDRINNNGNYCPENCRWTDHITQVRNSRHNHYITYDGETKCVNEWAEDKRCKVSLTTFKSRINKQWDIEEALTTMSNDHCKLYEYNGKKLTIPQWAKEPECRTGKSGLYFRINKKNMPFKEALTTLHGDMI